MTADVPAAAAETKDIPALEELYLELPYIPEFLLDDIHVWFTPTRDRADAAYLELVGEASRIWSAYYSKKGWAFVHGDARSAEGPFRLAPEGVHLTVLEPGRIFSPRPVLRLSKEGTAVPILSLEKRRPLNEWKPNYIQALNFIRKYEWPHSIPRSVQYAVWEIEECGQVAGSVSWKNAERILHDLDSKEVRLTLADLFFNRPEDYPLGSEVYLRVLGRSGPNGLRELLELAKHPSPASGKRSRTASETCETPRASERSSSCSRTKTRRCAGRRCARLGKSACGPGMTLRAKCPPTSNRWKSPSEFGPRKRCAKGATLPTRSSCSGS